VRQDDPQPNAAPDPARDPALRTRGAGAIAEAMAPGEDIIAPLHTLPERAPGRAARAATGLTPDGRLKAGKLAGLAMGSAIWVLAWPVLVDSILNSFVGLTDTTLAAGISVPATDAIGSAIYVMWFVGLFFMALDVGATALISRAVGARRMAVANAGVGQAILLAVTIGVSVGFLIFLSSWFMAPLMGLADEAESEFRMYLRIMAADVPFLAILVAGIACLRGAGDSFRPMRAMVVVNLVNMALTFTFSGVSLRHASTVAGHALTREVLHNPSPFHWGVTGIAVGTMIAHATGASIMLWTLTRPRGVLSLKRHRLRPHWHTMRRIIRVGFPNFLEMVGMFFGNFPIALMVGLLGAGLLGAHMVAIRLEAFSFQLGFAMGIAAAALAGQYLGAGSPQMARKAIIRCTVIGSAIMGTIGLVFIFYSRTIVGWISPQDLHLQITPQCLRITGMVQIPFAISLVLRSAMRGAGDVKVVMWITWITTYALRLPLAYIFSGVRIPLPQWAGGGTLANPFHFVEPGLASLWIGLCIEIIFRAAAFTARFLQGGWAHQRV
jgi:putative MATE family efflux protein